MTEGMAIAAARPIRSSGNQDFLHQRAISSLISHLLPLRTKTRVLVLELFNLALCLAEAGFCLVTVDTDGRLFHCHGNFSAPLADTLLPQFVFPGFYRTY